MFLQSELRAFRQFTASKVPFSLHFVPNLTYGKILIGQFLKRAWLKYMFLNEFFEGGSSLIPCSFFTALASSWVCPFLGLKNWIMKKQQML